MIVVIKLKYKTRKKLQGNRFFVAQVIDFEDNNTVTCKFMRKMDNLKFVFKFPNIEDIMTIKKSDIVKKLENVTLRRYILYVVENMKYKF